MDPEGLAEQDRNGLHLGGQAGDPPDPIAGPRDFTDNAVSLNVTEVGGDYATGGIASSVVAMLMQDPNGSLDPFTIIAANVSTAITSVITSPVTTGQARFNFTGPTFGFDVDRKAVTWLKKNGKFENPFSANWIGMTFWDSLEHLEDPGDFLACCAGWVFISIPTFENGDAVLQSKHFKPTEHRWYFSIHGMVKFMQYHHFECRKISNMETEIGREGISTFAFHRKSD